MNKSIQGLRGCFAIGVLLSHCFFLQNTSCSDSFNFILKYLANVGFFFMISGFFSIKKSNSNEKFRYFIKKKIRKIFPLNTLIILLTATYQLLKYSFSNFNLEFVNKIIANLLLIQTWIPIPEIFDGINHVSWFLSSLMFCYIFDYFATKKNNNAIIPISIIAIVYKLIIPFLLPENTVINDYFTYLFPLIGLGDFYLGKIIALQIDQEKNFNDNIITKLQVLASLMLIFMFFTKKYIPVNFSKSFYSLPFNYLLIYTFSRETNFSKTILGNKFLYFIGSCSFEIYLIHMLIITVLDKLNILNSIPGVLSILIIVSLTVSVSYVVKKILKAITIKKTIQKNY